MQVFCLDGGNQKFIRIEALAQIGLPMLARLLLMSRVGQTLLLPLPIFFSNNKIRQIIILAKNCDSFATKESFQEQNSVNNWVIRRVNGNHCR